MRIILLAMGTGDSDNHLEILLGEADIVSLGYYILRNLIFLITVSQGCVAVIGKHRQYCY